MKRPFSPAGRDCGLGLALSLLAVPAVSAVSAASAVQAASDAPAVSGHVYNFQALLDGKPIGEHRFDVVVDGQSRKVTSEADFAVRILGIRAYHYHHHADEQWTGDCLASLSATTDDDGKPSTVRLTHAGDDNQITSNGAQKSAPGCLMSYAYWNPAMREQTHLLNPQTGKVDTVHIERAGTGTIPVGGKDVAATRWRIAGAESPIDIWVSEQGEWIGLDSVVSKGKHTLSYRLR